MERNYVTYVSVEVLGSLLFCSSLSLSEPLPFVSPSRSRRLFFHYRRRRRCIGERSDVMHTIMVIHSVTAVHLSPCASAPWLGNRRRLFEMNMGAISLPPRFPFYAPIQLLPPFLPFSIPAFPFTFPLSLSLLPSPIFLPFNYPSYPPLSSLPYVPP